MFTESARTAETIGESLDVRHFVDLTQHEIAGLKTKWNLADAHTHQRQSLTQEKIVQNLPELWYEAEENQQDFFEKRFIEAFFRLHKQPTAIRTGRTLLSYSASVSTMVPAMYLMQRGGSVSLVEPCFDNLVDLLRHMRVPLTALPEEVLSDTETIYQRLVGQVTTDALYLVDPNNPTGFTLLTDGRRGFEEVVRFCRDHNKLLIIDFCFASFALGREKTDRFDVYELLENSGVSYVAIEDTGKTWPIQDAKCAMITVSADIYQEMYNIHTAVLLNVSPFVLNLVTRYIEDSIADDLTSVHDLVARNRRTLRDALEGSFLEYLEPRVGTSVAWYRITPPEVNATDLHERLVGAGVYVLPGTYFYWNVPAQGESYLRVALAREPELFEQAALRLREVVDNYAG